MRGLVLGLLLAEMALPAYAFRGVTAGQLEQILAAAHDKPDASVARRLDGLELTERLSTVRLEHWEAVLPGSEARQALVALADKSAFLDPPAAEIPAAAAPDPEAQRQLIALATGYAAKAIHRLPDFFATRQSILFEDMPAVAPFFRFEPLHSVGESKATVLYRNGKEQLDRGAANGAKSEAPESGLDTSGEFGTVLGVVLADSAQGKVSWSHWEQGADGHLAVFHYSVPSQKSHYEVKFCCIPYGSGKFYQQFSGYHGEIGINPANGAILRLTLRADLKPNRPMAKADQMVEYAPVEIGGKTYFCPVKSVTMVLGEQQARPKSYSEPLHFSGQLATESASPAPSEHLQTLLSDVVFSQYHLFRAETRVLTEDGAEMDRKPAEPQR